MEQWCQAADTPTREDSFPSYSETEEQQPGRVEIRRHWSTPVPAGLPTAEAWAKLTCVGRVESERQGPRGSDE